MKAHISLHHFLSLLLIVLLAAGCSGSGPAPVVYLDGYISSDYDVTGARVQIMDSDGKVIAEKAAATSDSGAFMVTVSGLPYGFRVVASGGTVSERSADYRLMAQFEGFKPGTDRIYVNLATTLVCAYLDRNPSKTLPNAVREVKAFLDIPAEVDLGKGLYHNNRYFSAATFLQEASANGGVEAFMGMLARQLTEDAGARHAFPFNGLGPPAGGALTACPGTTLAQAGRNGLVAWGVGFALNIGMSELFGIGGPSKEDIEEMKSMLRQIQEQLIDLKNEVENLKLGIYGLEYNLGTMLLSDYVTLVENAYTGLNIELQKDPATLTPNELIQRENTIKYWMKITGDQIKPHLGTLHTKLYGTLGSDGLYKSYARKLKEEKRFLSNENYQDRVKAALLYYNQIEATAVYLSAEYSRKENLSRDDIDNTIRQLGTNSQLEMDWFNSVTPMRFDVRIDKELNLMIHKGVDGDNWLNPTIPYNGTYAEAYYYVNSMNINAELYSSEPWMANWRIATEGEIKDFLKGNSSGIPPYQYLDAQGWTAPNPVPDPYYFGTPDGWIFQALNVTTGSWTEIRDQSWPGMYYAYYVFVRPITAGEKYFW